MTSEVSRFVAAVTARLDRAAERGPLPDFWWRDDDAVAATPALDRLLAIAAAEGVPIALAVIPAHADHSLARRLAAAAPEVSVLQHGFAHHNHEPAGSKAAELGDARPLATVVAELVDGRRRLEDLFAGRFRPVLTPPWNRISANVAAHRDEAGLPGLSAAGSRAPDRHRTDIHLDPIAWRTTRGFRGFAHMLAGLDEEIAARAEITGGPADGTVSGMAAGKAVAAPIGILTHHLVHDEAVWEFTAAMVAAIARHPAARFVSPGA